jgi:hypothetical protein
MRQSLSLAQLESAAREEKIGCTTSILAPRLNPDKPELFEQAPGVMRRMRPFEELSMPSRDLTFVTVLTL